MNRKFCEHAHHHKQMMLMFRIVGQGKVTMGCGLSCLSARQRKFLLVETSELAKNIWQKAPSACVDRRKFPISFGRLIHFARRKLFDRSVLILSSWCQELGRKIWEINKNSLWFERNKKENSGKIEKQHRKALVCLLNWI